MRYRAGIVCAAAFVLGALIAVPIVRDKAPGRKARPEEVATDEPLLYYPAPTVTARSDEVPTERQAHVTTRQRRRHHPAATVASYRTREPKAVVVEPTPPPEIDEDGG